VQVLFLLSKNVASTIAQTVTFFTGIIFYKKSLKFTKQLYACFYAFKVLCFYSWQSYLETIIIASCRGHPTGLPFLIIATFSTFSNCIFFTGKS